MEFNRKLHVVMYNIKFPKGIVLDEGLIFLIRCPMLKKSIMETTIGFFSLIVVEH
jgi:hypothetical protein